MTKLRLLGLMIVTLVIMNVVLLSIFFFVRPNKSDDFRKGPDQPKKVIINRLHFDNNQISAYEDLIAEHRLKVRKLDDDIRETKNKLYVTINQNETKSVDSLIARLGALQEDIETVHYNHFKDIKKLCKANQLSYFNELTKDLGQIFSHEKNLPPPPRDL